MTDEIFGEEMNVGKVEIKRKKDDLNIYHSVRGKGQLLLVSIDVESHMCPTSKVDC